MAFFLVSEWPHITFDPYSATHLAGPKYCFKSVKFKMPSPMWLLDENMWMSYNTYGRGPQLWIAYEEISCNLYGLFLLTKTSKVCSLQYTSQSTRNQCHGDTPLYNHGIPCYPPQSYPTKNNVLTRGCPLFA